MDIRALEALLREHQKTRSELARCLGRHPSAITQLFKGERLLKVEEIAKIANLLNMSSAELVDRLGGDTYTSKRQNEEIHQLAFQRAMEVIRKNHADLSDEMLANFVFELFSIGVEEQTREGKAVLTYATAERIFNYAYRDKATGNG